MSLLLTNSRLPFVLARSRLLPSALARVAETTGTPWVAVVVSSLFYAAFASLSFRDLVVLDVWLYSLTILVELAAFIQLRRREPGLARPWRVPAGVPGAIVVAVLPSLLALTAMVTAGWRNILAGVVAALTGPVFYAVWRRRGSRR